LVSLGKRERGGTAKRGGKPLGGEKELCVFAKQKKKSPRVKKRGGKWQEKGESVCAASNGGGKQCLCGGKGKKGPEDANDAKRGRKSCKIGKRGPLAKDTTSILERVGFPSKRRRPGKLGNQKSGHGKRSAVGSGKEGEEAKNSFWWAKKGGKLSYKR